MTKTIVITGGSSGIGYALAKKLLKRHRVFIMALNASTCALAQAKKCKVYTVDVTKVAQIQSCFSKIKKEARCIDALINCAGIGFGTPLSKLSEKTYQKMMDTNLKGMFFVTKSALPLIKKGGVICNISSVAGITGFKDWTLYCASKFAVEGFTKALREELRNKKIKVMVVRPGSVDTPLYHFLKKNEKKDFMKPETIAEIIAQCLFLEANACAEEIFINNQVGNI